MTSKTPKLDMEATLKTLWGASAWPFAAAVDEPCATSAHEETLRRLEQCIAVHSSGVLHGPNGVGKSRLVQSLVERLPPKVYRTVVLSYSSLSGTDVIRYLCHLHGIPVAQRRSDNLMALRTMWSQRDGLWPVWIFEEAQNLTAMGLEELRLLSCERLDTQSPFSLLLVGDAALMPRLQMGVNRPLLTRLGFCLRLEPWPREEACAYVQRRLEDVGLHENVFDPDAQELLLRIAGGIPRTINYLGQRAFEEAARERSRTIGREHIQKALDQLPWLGRLREED
jgi:type II secretory pathway predicted ATPase ExeA